MLILAHVIIALSSIAHTTYLLTHPSPGKFKVAYGLVAATLASGSYLVVSTRAHLLRACTMGLVYLAIVSYGIVSARQRLASAEIDNKTD